MDEYISREDVLDNSNIITVHTKEYGSIDVIPVDTIADIELADVQDVVHAYWIELPRALNPNENPCKCSNCGHVLSFMNYYPKSKYCDDCGARMDLNGATPDRCRNYIDCDGSCYIDDTPCECGGNIEKCKGRDTE